MRLEDFKTSVTKLTWEEQLALHREIRQSRVTRKEPVNKTKAVKREKITSAKKEIKQDVNKLKELLRLLGEDV